ncbi:MAG: alpha/beta hydrolase [Vicinamibacteria bacterium]
MAQNESLFLAGPAGRLEALLMHPEGAAVGAAVVCHADPRQGGVMHFKVVFRAAKALQEQGLAVLRFNFRGVGLSEGTHNHGQGEQGDARAALDEMAHRFPGLPLVLGGFSFGSVVAARVAGIDPRVRALFLVGFPVARFDDLAFLATLRVPRLFIQGAGDVFGTGEALRAAVAPLPEPRSLVVVPEADHFFTGKLEALQDAITTWAAVRPWQAA